MLFLCPRARGCDQGKSRYPVKQVATPSNAHTLQGKHTKIIIIIIKKRHGENIEGGMPSSVRWVFFLLVFLRPDDEGRRCALSFSGFCAGVHKRLQLICFVADICFCRQRLCFSSALR